MTSVMAQEVCNQPVRDITQTIVAVVFIAAVAFVIWAIER